VEIVELEFSRWVYSVALIPPEGPPVIVTVRNIPLHHEVMTSTRQQFEIKIGEGPVEVFDDHKLAAQRLEELLGDGS
jgi:hypothetical protein